MADNADASSFAIYTAMRPIMHENLYKTEYECIKMQHPVLKVENC